MAKPIVLCGEAQGENEAAIGKGFVGASGIELLRMLNEAGIIEFTEADNSYFSKYYQVYDPSLIDCIWQLHPEVYRTNVFQQHPQANRIESFCGPKDSRLLGYPPLIKGKYVRAEFKHELERLGDELVSIDPNLIICLGNTALWALAGKTGVSKLRGTTSISTHTASGFKLLSTYHPAAVLRQWELRPVTVADLMRGNWEKEFPEIRRPEREIWIEPTIKDIIEFTDRYITDFTGTLSVDIETAGNQVTCIGFSPGPKLALVVPFTDARRKGRNYWPNEADEKMAWGLIKGILSNKKLRKVFQNGLYDIAFLWRAYGIKVYGASEDTMLLHHALQPEALKGLGFLGSVYTNEGSWKNERKGNTTIKRDE